MELEDHLLLPLTLSALLGAMSIDPFKGKSRLRSDNIKVNLRIALA